jgi:hypothetical protein
MYPTSSVAVPVTVFSLPLSLLERVGGWDTDPTGIADDYHMMLKCYFRTDGDMVSHVIPIPASQCNISSDAGLGCRRTVMICWARYRQGLRHMWGALDAGYAVRECVKRFRLDRSCILLQPRCLLILQRLYAGLVCQCHLPILGLFFAWYRLHFPSLHPTMSWVIQLTDMLCLLTFVLMGICLALYQRWHTLCLNVRERDMIRAQVADTGFSPRRWWHFWSLLENICIPIAAFVFAWIPLIQAVFTHFWTESLVFRVSRKPVFITASDEKDKRIASRTLCQSSG